MIACTCAEEPLLGVVTSLVGTCDGEDDREDDRDADDVDRQVKREIDGRQTPVAASDATTTPMRCKSISLMKWRYVSCSAVMPTGPIGSFLLHGLFEDNTPDCVTVV